MRAVVHHGVGGIAEPHINAATDAIVRCLVDNAGADGDPTSMQNPR